MLHNSVLRFHKEAFIRASCVCVCVCYSNYRRLGHINLGQSLTASSLQAGRMCSCSWAAHTSLAKCLLQLLSAASDDPFPGCTRMRRRSSLLLFTEHLESYAPTLNTAHTDTSNAHHGSHVIQKPTGASHRSVHDGNLKSIRALCSP